MTSNPDEQRSANVQTKAAPKEKEMEIRIEQERQGERQRLALLASVVSGHEEHAQVQDGDRGDYWGI